MSYGAGSYIGTAHSSGTHIRPGLNPAFRQTQTLRSMFPNYANDNGTGIKQAVTETSHNYSQNLVSTDTGIAKATGVFDLATHFNYNKKNNWVRINSNNFHQENYADFSAKVWQFSSSQTNAKFYQQNTNNFNQWNDPFMVQSYRFYTTDITKYRIFLGFWIPGATAFYHDLCIGAIQLINLSNNTREYAVGPTNDNSDFTSLKTTTNASNWTAFISSSIISTNDTLNNFSFSWDHTVPDNYTTVTVDQSTTNQWNVGNITNSPFTGANNGINISFGSDGTGVLPSRNESTQSVNGELIVQSNTKFLFFESSSPTARFDATGFYTPRITLKPHTLYSLRVAYMLMTRSGLGASNPMWTEVVPQLENYRT